MIENEKPHRIALCTSRRVSRLLYVALIWFTFQQATNAQTFTVSSDSGRKWVEKGG